jgi:hypothetical protein
MALTHMTTDHGWEINVIGAETQSQQLILTPHIHKPPPSNRVRLNGYLLFSFLTSTTDRVKSHVKIKNNHMRLLL